MWFGVGVAMQARRWTRRSLRLQPGSCCCCCWLLLLLQAACPEAPRQLVRRACPRGLCCLLQGSWRTQKNASLALAPEPSPTSPVLAPELSRTCLQEILADACRELAGEGIILNSVNVVDYEQGVDPQTGRKVRGADAEG